MKRFTEQTSMMAFAVVLLMSFCATLAQPAPPEGGGRGADRRGDRGMRMEDMTDVQRQQMMERFEQRRKEMIQQQNERMRENLGMSEEAFEVLEPMISKVRQLSGESMFAGRSFGGFGGRSNRGGGRGFNPFGSQEMSPQGQALSEATDTLRETLEDDAAISDQIKEQLAALRKARVAMQDALRQAREELRGFLTQKQEAMLVLNGLLD